MDKKYMAVGSSMLILKLLEQQDMYGYQIIKELEIRSERVFTLKEGTLYPLLHALEQDGAVICEQRTAENGRGQNTTHRTIRIQKCTSTGKNSLI